MDPNCVESNSDLDKSISDQAKCSVDDLNADSVEDCCKNTKESTTASQNEDSDNDDHFSDAKDVCSDEELELDEEAMKEEHKDLSDQDLEVLKEEAILLKSKGNECFKKAEYKESISFYTAALNKCPLKYESDRSILYANRGAARIGLELNEEAVLDCNKAIELNPDYLKAILRRAQLHRKMDSPEKALEDYKRVVELDPNNSEARQACVTLPPEIAERNERLKNEMFGKLKELGNLCLRPFGLSTENFKVVQDPNSGGYSVNFQNNQS